MSNDEPDYIKAIKRAQEKRTSGDQSKRAPASLKSGPPSPAEREAIRWAREVGGKDVRIAPSLTGAKLAVLIQPITPFGSPPVTVEGLNGRDALADRVKSAQGGGENVLGCFELTTGRPLTAELADGKVTFTAGAAREIMKSQSPDRMIRLAAKQAEELAKTRKLDDRDKGGRGQGGRR